MKALAQLCSKRNPTEITRSDLAIASMAWGFTMGFGFLTTWTAMKQTALVHRRYGVSRLNSPYIWMIWLEILVCLTLSVICWLHLPRIFIYHRYEMHACPSDILKPTSNQTLVTCWSLQIHFLLQIIINRVSILLTSRRKANILKYGVAVFITAVNISMYCTWVPGRLHPTERWKAINNIWDYVEKVIYLIVDACLNLYFMYIIQANLVRKGLVKYDRLLRFNQCIIGFSLSMDCLIIGTMSLNNSLVYVQFHPLAYMVKLNIEMAMTELMTKVACSPNPSARAPQPLKGLAFIHSDPKMNFEEASPTDRQMYNQFHSTQEIVWREKATFSDFILDHCSEVAHELHPECKFHLTREVHIETEQRRSLQGKCRSLQSDNDGTEQVMAAFEQKLRKLRAKEAETDSIKSCRRGLPIEEDLGSQTKIWGPAG
ncbi:BgTH12-05327 [Blumeria graminis f. sp. triticale]|uniref:BgTH12-05327 n=1 Tax=Blumeria graminis f. sp. triticale TaxID=1689686 RepID=A0A9W4D2I7_BLUGR|nr:BgTH12-05327 [Blumeria graminis f. sp. triticale]